MAEIRPAGQYMLWDGQDWNILNGPPGLDGNMTELWQTGAPPAGAPGSRWVDSVTLAEHVWDRTANTWKPLGAGGGSSGHTIRDEGAVLPARGSIDFVGSGVTAVDDPANNKTVVNVTGLGSGLDQATADGLYVNILGDTMNGNLFINGALSVQGAVGGVAAAFDTLTTTGTAQVGGAVTLLGPVTASSTLTLAGDPVSNLQAATKKYVDDHSGGQPHAVKDENDAALPARGNLRFAGPSVKATDDAANNATLVTLSNPNIIVLGPTDPIPPGTPTGTVVIRT